MGVAYHAHYLVWFELGRTELMRASATSYRELEDASGLAFPVIEAQARYLRSARYDEEVEIETRVARLTGARVVFDYRLTRVGDGELLATGRTIHASVGRDGRPVRLPRALREQLMESTS